MAKNHTSQQNGGKSSKVAVVMVPLPAQGHLNQLLHLSRLISAYKIPVYYVGAATHLRQAKLRVHGWDPSAVASIQFHDFPESTPFENPPPDPNSSHKFPSQLIPSLAASTHFRRPVFEFVDGLSAVFRRVIVIYDYLMSYVVQDIDSIQNADYYNFRSISAFTVSSWQAVNWPDLPAEAEILKELPSLDGYYPQGFADFLNLQSGTRKIYSGEIYNSSREIEGLYLDLLAKRQKNGAENIWALGPFNPISILPEKRDSNNLHKCLQWLDKQGPNSVIFVSFGTTSSFSDEQIKEIAFGLERSGQKFIWVLRDADKGDIFSGDVRKFQLPDGFEKRVQERGIIVRDWAPQLEILGHPSTGGFMTHCGWNSCLESISNGVPIAAWPMHSDQPGNAVLITKVLRIGVEVKYWSRRAELVPSRRVEKTVRKLMESAEGDEARKRAAELGNAVKKSSVEGGDTHREMESFIAHITR